MAIGVDPRRPVITEDLIDPANWVAMAHNLLLMGFEAGPQLVN